jgi:hypothetical protein
LGHASRDVAIIDRLLERGHRVLLGGDGPVLGLLQTEFPELDIIRFPSKVRIRYSLHLPAWLKITLLSPLLLYEIFRERFILAGIVRRSGIDAVISDNRYGLRNRNVLSILITHQLNLHLPRSFKFLEYPLNRFIRILIRKFDVCWVPDFPGSVNLSGDLTHRFPPPKNAHYIGAISRFTRSPEPDILEKQRGTTQWIFSSSTASKVDLVILISGPEPQRSRLEKIVLKQSLSLRSSCVILQGIPDTSGVRGKIKRMDLSSKVTLYNHLPRGELRRLLLSARHVICRSGYTGIMDLALMKKKALIIPTPGQTEQEYLAEYLSLKGMFLSCNQEELNLESALKDLSLFEPRFGLPENDLLGKEISRNFI